MKVKIFFDSSTTKLEESVNTWLEDNSYKVLTIEVTSNKWGMGILITYDTNQYL